jgi:tetratricopeptide (TPR) repeat protein
MKLLGTLLLFVFASFFVYSQNWKDSLTSARKLYKKGEYVSSLEKYKSAQKLAPKEIDLSDEIGQTAYKAQDFKEAQEAFNRSSSRQGSKIDKSKVYHNLGNTQLKQKKYNEAIESYKQALRNNPEDKQTRYNLAEALKKQKSQQDKKDDPKDKKNKDKQENQEKKDKQDSQDPKNQQNKQNNEGNKEDEAKSKLSDKATERMLDDLTKKEIETKKKIGGNKGKKSNKSSGKDW